MPVSDGDTVYDDVSLTILFMTVLSVSPPDCAAIPPPIVLEMLLMPQGVPLGSLWVPLGRLLLILVPFFPRFPILFVVCCLLYFVAVPYQYVLLTMVIY